MSTVSARDTEGLEKLGVRDCSCCNGSGLWRAEIEGEEDSECPICDGTGAELGALDEDTWGVL